jgi:cytidine deaminase
MIPERMIEIAHKAQENAYCPYSQLKVGAALLSKTGKIYLGTNVENASYGLTICAERVALFKAVSEGDREFKSLAVTSSKKGFIYPCGACLQVLAEFSPDLLIITSDENNNYNVYNLKDLLPQVFKITLNS